MRDRLKQRYRAVGSGSILLPEFTIFNHTTKTYGGVTFSEAGAGLVLGFSFAAMAPVNITGISFWKTSDNLTTSRKIALYNGNTQALLGQATSVAEQVGSNKWIDISFASPISLAGEGLSKQFVAAVHFPQIKYAAIPGAFNNGLYSSDNKFYVFSTSEYGNGRYDYNADIKFPTQFGGGADYMIDVKYTVA